MWSYWYENVVFLILMQVHCDSITHFEFHKHLGSFWKWEFLELGNYFVIRLSVYLSCARDVYKIWACKRRETRGDFQKKRRPEIRQCAFAGYPVSKCQEQVKRIALKKDFFREIENEFILSCFLMSLMIIIGQEDMHFKLFESVSGSVYL